MVSTQIVVHSWTGVCALLAPRVVHTTHPSIADAGNATSKTTTIAMINVYHFFELEKKWQLCWSERKNTIINVLQIDRKKTSCVQVPLDLLSKFHVGKLKLIWVIFCRAGKMAV